MASNNTRFLIIPDIEIDGDHIVSVTNSSDEREEAGPITEQPVAPDTGSLPGGDIRLTLSGVPDGPHRDNTVRVTFPSTVDNGRFGWVRDEDLDLQMRQSMRVLGRLPALVDENSTPATYSYFVRPRALPLNNGDLFCTWLTATLPPTQQGFGANIKTATLSADYTWSAVATASDLALSSISTGITGYGMVQYPDTDEIVLTKVERNSGGSPRVMVTFVSEDNGATWIERRRNLFSAPDLILSESGTTDNSQLIDVDLDLTDNGRLVALLVTQEMAWSLTSDDRGRTWVVASLIEDWSGAAGGGTVWGATASLTRLRNGLILAAISRPHTTGGELSGIYFLYSTFDGQSWGTKESFGGTSQGSTAAAVAIRPDGYPVVYSTLHHTETGPDVYRDWLAVQNSGLRDLSLDLSDDDAFTNTTEAFHTFVSSPSGDLDATPVFQGFEGIDVANWRGQIVLIAAVQFMNPTFDETNILLYRTFHWQPLQEKLDDVDNVPGTPADGMVYNHTWEPYAAAPDFSWTGVGAGTNGKTAVSGGATDDGGYTEFITVANTRYFEETALPDSLTTRGCAFRFVVRYVSGGDSTKDSIAFRIFLSDGANSFDLSFRLSQAAAVTTLNVLDNHLGASIGSQTYTETGTPTLGNFIEVVAVVESDALTAFSRQHEPTPDPEFDVGYDAVVSNVALTIASGATEAIRFGNQASDTATSDWKTVQLQREDGGSPSLFQRTLSFEDEDSNEIPATTSAVDLQSAIFDAGLLNYMRTSQLTAHPAQYITGNVSATFRGEATLTGNYGYETAYSYARENLLDGPVAQEWRSSEDVAGLSDDIEILIDGGSNLQYKPTGLAVFGRNWNTMRIQMNDTDSWGAPRVDVLYSTPNDPLSGSADRMTHMWSNDAALFTSTVAGRQLVCINTVTANGPWRAHQFRSQETGPWYYLMLIDTGGSDASNRKIYKILDNDEGKLTLDGDPGADGFSSGVNFDIFSDRFAVELGPRHSVLDTAYRYIKITIYGVNHRDDDEQFQRVGRFVLGYAHDMSGPMFDWGWSRNESSGSSIATGTNGVRYATRNHSPRRKFQARYRMLRAPLEADEVTGSPLTSWRSPGDSWFFGGGGSPKTWGHVVDILRRLEMDGRRAALVWDGDRAVDIGSTSAVVQTAADPMELLMVRVTNVGNMQHIGYEGQDKNLAGGTECKPTPMMQQTYTFEEDF